MAGDSYIIARVPEAATAGELVVADGEQSSEKVETYIGVQIADSLHPVSNPAVDAEGNVYSTFSGSRGQKSPVSLYKVDTSFNSKPFVTDLMNPTGLAFDPDGLLYVSSRYDGIVYQVTPSGNMTVYVEGMGVATGLAFDREGNLYVGDRSGTIFKISRSRQIYVYATLEPSIAAYHLTLGPEGYLYVTGPTTSSYDAVYRISTAGEVETFYRGLGRPQGTAFDAAGRLYVAASLRGRRGIIRIDQDRKAEQFLIGSGDCRCCVYALSRDDFGDAQCAVPRGCRHRGPADCLSGAMAKNAEIIAVGSELLTPQRVDTNSLIITEYLNRLGVEVVRKLVIGDDRERLAEAIRYALKRSEIVILIGGLGPTEDDVTRDAAAEALGRKLTLSLEQESVLIARFRQINRPMAKNNLRQAYLLEGAEAMPNPHGTAPGQFIYTDRGGACAIAGSATRVEADGRERACHAVAPGASAAGDPSAFVSDYRHWRIGSRRADCARIQQVHKSGDYRALLTGRSVRTFAGEGRHTGTGGRSAPGSR